MNKYPGIYFASSVGNINNQHVLVEVINLNYTPKTLYAGTNIGKMGNRTCQNFLFFDSKRKNRFLSFLCRFPDLYAKGDKDSGQTSLVEHRINTGSSRTIRKFPFRTAPKEKEIITKEVEALEARGIIEKSSPPLSTCCPSQEEGRWTSNVYRLQRSQCGDKK